MSWGLRQRSAKREAERTEREAVIREVRQRDRFTCRAKHVVPEVACGGNFDVHEIIPRSAWRRGYLVLANCILVCRRHHEWIDANPDEAHERGLHGYSWEVTDECRGG